ncbi:MAG: NAD(P)H-dependent oxidoreductase [Chloroflexota bacterium]|nr:NAD(P)H-dependent oxidoreductase [Dehalococcoidia bacterium]MDW8047005.1 NAD(P)H-dependent oxidoreductase [Chloroflexota bacterium]
MVAILVLYDSRGGLVEQLAQAVAEGVREAGGTPLPRRVDDAVPEELLQCDGLVLGSPNWSGITGKLKEWWDHSGDLWETGELAGKPAGAFTAGYSRSGGTEATLLQLLHLLLSHGMLFVGLPWSERMRRSGSYYGATAHGEVTPDDLEQARALGRRITEVAFRLSGRPGGTPDRP